ncbi:MAG: secretory protein YscJ/FliF family protein [Planctomycetaceae bacterium]|nr:secretory protein YscJ/FliF family protein [Planctomycetaceae bacterium]
MDGWAQKIDQLRSLVRGFSPMQRMSLCAVSLTILGLCCWLGYSAYHPKQEFLLGGKAFSKDELSRTLEAFKVAGLVQHRVEGQRISVPALEADRYTAAAVAQKALPAQFAAEFDRMQSRVNVFTSSEQRRELLEEARKSRLAQILRAIPEIEDAVVEWDRPKSTSLFRPQNQLAAHVSVRPRGGHQLSLELVQSLKQFVAGALAGAKPEDVTVVDMNTSHVHGRRTTAEAASDRIQSLARQSADDVTRQIKQALQYIPHVLVSVNVEMLSEVEADRTDAIDDLDVVPIQYQTRRGGSPRNAWSNRSIAATINPVSLSKREFQAHRTARTLTSDSADSTHAEAPNLEGMLHKSVQVAIAIPEDFYSTLALRQGIQPGTTLVADSEFRAAVANIKMESQHGIREQLSRLLPLGTPAESISITNYTRLSVPPESGVNMKPAGTRSKTFWDWVSLSGMVFTGLCVCWLVSRLALRNRDRATAANRLDVVEEFPLGTLDGDLKTDTSLKSGFAELQTAPKETLKPPPEALNPYSAILSELAERERDSVLGPPGQGGMFEFLCQLAPAELAEFLQQEHPQTIALVASGMPPTRAAETLHALPEALRWEVTQRISRLGHAAPEVCREVAQSLASRLHESAGKTSKQTPAVQRRPGFRQRTVSRQQQSETSTDIVSGSVSTSDRGPVSFEDLCVLDRMSFAAVLRAVDANSFAVALFDRPEPFKQKFVSMLPRAVAADILRQTRELGPLRLSDITATQDAIAGIVWKLAQQGTIQLPPHLVRPRNV